jgi:hypothetical protein
VVSAAHASTAQPAISDPFSVVATGHARDYVVRGERQADRVETVADAPQYGLLFYNLACLECLTGDLEEAVTHLRKAFELSGQFRRYAREDSDLDAVRDDPVFAELIAEETEPVAGV